MGIAELLAVLFIVLLFFGASRLPRSERASARRSEAQVGDERRGGWRRRGEGPPRELPPGDDDSERDGR